MIPYMKRNLLMIACLMAGSVWAQDADRYYGILNAKPVQIDLVSQSTSDALPQWMPEANLHYRRTKQANAYGKCNYKLLEGFWLNNWAGCDIKIHSGIKKK